LMRSVMILREQGGSSDVASRCEGVLFYV
jgi:hypothetical protein